MQFFTRTHYHRGIRIIEERTTRTPKDVSFDVWHIPGATDIHEDSWPLTAKTKDGACKIIDKILDTK